MEALAKSDIFFVITGVAVVLVTLLLVAVLFYIIKILRDVKDVTTKVKKESEHIIDDVSFFRKGIKKTGAKVKKTITNKLSNSK